MPKESLALVLRAQPDKTAAFTLIALSLDRLVKLYQIPNWSKENSEYLAEWIFDNYTCESLEFILETLKNPPVVESTAWRLTPDTIRNWMCTKLDKEAEKREAEIQKQKKSETSIELPIIDYNKFKEKLVDGCLPENQPKFWHQDKGYQRYKQERRRQLFENNSNNHTGSTQKDSKD